MWQLLCRMRGQRRGMSRDHALICPLGHSTPSPPLFPALKYPSFALAPVYFVLPSNLVLKFTSIPVRMAAKISNRRGYFH